jgi:hypothetical protein
VEEKIAFYPDTFRPQSRPHGLMALSRIPPAVPFDSIIGQVRSGSAQDGSDGVVPYSSSHLDAAESELVIRHGHEAFKHPDAVREIQRILQAHLGEGWNSVSSRQ